MASMTLPLVLAGPILRLCSPKRFVLWMAVSELMRIRITLNCPKAGRLQRLLLPSDPGVTWLTAGRNLHYVMIDLNLDHDLDRDVWIGYEVDLQPLTDTNQSWIRWQEWAPDLCYPGKSSPGFVLPSRVYSLMHGSCRKPHHTSSDGLVEADRFLGDLIEQGLDKRLSEYSHSQSTSWPSLLMMTGDQVYVDDVAGPMLHAIHQVIMHLDLPDEPFTGTAHDQPNCASALYQHPASFYQRETLLPRQKQHFDLVEILFGGVEKPVFTTDSAHNHLITVGEMLAMYLLVWSPALWEGVKWGQPSDLSPESQSLYEREQTALKVFVGGLSCVRRLLAHVPTAMIFDDHDMTDDWNISREWEEVAYSHPFSRRVIGNALIAYAIHQGWGNQPDKLTPLISGHVQSALDQPGSMLHDQAIDALLVFREWHYTWQTDPPLVVVDTRTHRWRSETAARKPSGLMDWESLTDLQQRLKGLPAVLLVTPTPIFGVKLIEVIQRVFSWFGRPLMVDAENWMAHPGSGHAILNVFRHPKTPRHFVVLSGDVHYSFVYDVELRGRIKGPEIWQICSSGLRNTFPSRLLDILDVMNRWLYSPRSPLNWLTRRRNMRITPRKPEGIAHGRRLLNGSGVGLVELDEQGVPWRISHLLAGGRSVLFTRREKESRWE